ncbi:hypothetical protein GCM10007084_38690 [Parabacteroides faecis]|nr:hypothetical protein GCM10007084_38690 [Parabacteroides faecis]
MIKQRPQPDHKYNSIRHSCRNCYKWKHCKFGENRPTSLTADYGLYGCIEHQLNSSKKHEKKKIK